jgi:hypothetical protein
MFRKLVRLALLGFVVIVAIGPVLAVVSVVLAFILVLLVFALLGLPAWLLFRHFRPAKPGTRQAGGERSVPAGCSRALGRLHEEVVLRAIGACRAGWGSLAQVGGRVRFVAGILFEAVCGGLVGALLGAIAGWESGLPQLHAALGAALGVLVGALVGASRAGSARRGDAST